MGKYRFCCLQTTYLLLEAIYNVYIASSLLEDFPDRFW